MMKRLIIIMLAVACGFSANAQTKINLATQVRNILPTANGGTGNGTGNAPTASSLLSTPTICTTGQAPRGILANGNATGCASYATVTSVGLSMPSWFSVANSPVTGSGTLTVTAAGSQTAHQVIGTCGTATSFAPCSLVAGDIPALAYLSNASGAANLVMATPNGASGSPSLRALVGADIPAINLAASGNGGVTGNLPVGNLNSGTGATSSTFWRGDGTWSVTPNSPLVFSPGGNPIAGASGNTTALQLVNAPGQYTIPAGAENTVGKSFRITTSGFANNGSGTAEQISIDISIGGAANILVSIASVANGQTVSFSAVILCTTSATGSSGAIQCGATVNSRDPVGGTTAGNGFPQFQFISLNLTLSQVVSDAVQFGNASASNTFDVQTMVVEQLN